MAIRLGDANPRRLVRMFNSLLLEVSSAAISDRKKVPLLSKKQQTRVLIHFSSGTLSRVQSEPEVGPELHQFIKQIGEYMQYSLYDRPLTTDQMSFIRLTQKTDRAYWPLIQHGVALGLLYPNVNTNDPDELSKGNGTFHLAYVLAPLFRILPRRDKALGLSTLMRRRAEVRLNESFMNMQHRLFT